MKVKIIKASKESLWYSNKIGEIFDVQPIKDKKGKKLSVDWWSIGDSIFLVRKEDCEEI